MKGDKGGLLFCWLYAEYAGIQPRNCISDALASNEYFDCLSVFRFRCRHLIYRLDLFCVFPPPFILMSYEFFFIFYFQLIHSICFIFRTLRKRQKKNEWGKVKKKKKNLWKGNDFYLFNFSPFVSTLAIFLVSSVFILPSFPELFRFILLVLQWMQWKLHLSPALFFLFFFYFNSLTLSLIYSR